MQVTIEILRCHVSAAIEELGKFAELSFKLEPDKKFCKILVRSDYETDILKVRNIEKKYNYE